MRNENTLTLSKIERNPFIDPIVARQWISSVEGETGSFRDGEIYPRLRGWLRLQKTSCVIEIGSGQGICSIKIGDFEGQYIGVEPSLILAQRAQELYSDAQRQFAVGDAYNLPIESGVADAVFSVMVWFHLESLHGASKEMGRILEPGGRFMIVTANPKAVSTWESFYIDMKKNGNRVSGGINVPINPMSKSVWYQHTQDEILNALERNGLIVQKVGDFGTVKGENLFFSVEGIKDKD